MTNPRASCCLRDGRLATEWRRANARTDDRPLSTLFFRNGDEFHPGQRVYVGRGRYPTLDRLLGDLSRLLEGPVNLPYGVRQIFRAEDGRRVESVEDIVSDDGARRRFVCAGFEAFRPLQYGRREAERWQHVGKSSTNSSLPLDIVFRKNHILFRSSLEAEERSSTLAQSTDSGVNITSTGNPPYRLRPKPDLPKKMTNGADPGDTRSGKTMVKSETVKSANMEDDYHSTELTAVTSKEIAPLTTGTECHRRLRRTSEVFRSPTKARPSSDYRGNSGGTRKTHKNITMTFRKTAEICESSGNAVRSPEVADVERKTLENVERPKDVGLPPTTNIPNSSEKTSDIPQYLQITPHGSWPNRRRSCATPLSLEEISLSSVESSSKTASDRSTPGSLMQPVAVALNSIAKSAFSTRNTDESLPSFYPLVRHSAFPQTHGEPDTPIIPRIPTDVTNDSGKILQTKTSRNSMPKPSKLYRANSKSMKSADSEQLGPRKKGSKPRSRKPAPKSNRLIVETGFLEKRFEMGEVLGEGNFAVVRRCKARDTGMEYAVKVISKSKLKVRLVDNEVDILRSCQHLNIVRMIECHETKTEFYLVMELVEGGDLFEAIRCRQRFPEAETSSMVKDMATALQYLHQRKIVHRDVKPENFLIQLESDGSVKHLKLADFGLAVAPTGPLFKLCGTPTYVAPEILSDIGYGSEVDMWSVGIILYVLLSGYPPFRSTNRQDDSELFDLIQCGQFVFHSPRWDHISDGARDLINRLLEINVRKRLRAEEVLRHPWIMIGTTAPPSPISKDNDPLSASSTNRTANLNHPHQ